MTLHRYQSCTIYYRTHGGENSAPRPPWYSKELCLRSLLKSIENAKQDHLQVKLITLHDGPLSSNAFWRDSLRDLVGPVGEIIELPKRNNALSCLDAIHRACGQLDDEIVLFAEDDYLWLRPAVSGICSALTTLPCDYVTGYDHPVRYQPDYPLGADWPHWYTTIHITEERHWRSQESTCMTFASCARTLKADIPYFERYHDNGKGTPDDRKLFRHLCGLGDYAKQETPRRILMGPLPSLNTHLHLPWLAPLIDWKLEADAVMAQER
jgi:hypothetical protein